MTSRRGLHLLGPVLGVAAWLAPSLAKAGELQADAGVDLGATTWRGDYLFGGQLRLGYRFAHVVAIDFVGWEHFASVDTRMATGLTLGVTGFLPLEVVRPSLRAFVIHQHEEALVSVEEEPGGVLIGIGAGIRHRAGLGGTIGLEIPIEKSGSIEYVAFAGGTFTGFPDDTLGPAATFALAGGLGLNYEIPSLP